MDYESESEKLEDREPADTDLAAESQRAAVKAAVEAIIYVAEEPVTVKQIVAALAGSMGIRLVESDKPRKRKVQPLIQESSEGAPPEAEIAPRVEEPSPEETSLREDVERAIAGLQEDSKRSDRGLEIREIAGGYKMFTKAEHHETIRLFAKSLTPPLRLSIASLETLATIAYRQPVTVPEIQAIRGVSAAGVLKTLLDRKLITIAGRKEVMGRPILYKTTREFLVKFGLNSLNDLPTLEEFGEIARAALGGEVLEEPSAETADEGSEISSDYNEIEEGGVSSGHSLSLVEPLEEGEATNLEEPPASENAASIAGGENNGN